MLQRDLYKFISYSILAPYGSHRVSDGIIPVLAIVEETRTKDCQCYCLLLLGKQPRGSLAPLHVGEGQDF